MADPNSDHSTGMKPELDSTENHEKEGEIESQETGSINGEEPSIREIKNKWRNLLKNGYIVKKVLKRGIPSGRPRRGDTCTVSFVGRLEDGTVVDEATDLEIHYTYNEVIQGLDMAVGQMNVGEEAELRIDPSLGYGSAGRRPDIGPAAALTYTVVLTAVRTRKPAEELCLGERLSLGLRLRERGDWWYSRNEYGLAVGCYGRALEYLGTAGVPRCGGDEELQRLRLERANAYSSLAEAQIKVSAFDAALTALDNVLGAQPDNVKALLSKSKVLKEQGRLMEGLKAARRAMASEAASQALQREDSSVLQTHRKHNARKREIFRNLLRAN